MEGITNILTSPTFWSNVPSFIILIVVLAVLAKIFKVQIKTDHITVGGESQASFTERAIIREQCDFAHEYLRGLIGKIEPMMTEEDCHKYGGYRTKYILEIVYDEMVKWITFNHITDDQAYITSKQNKICAMVYAENVNPEFKTPEFQDRMKRWVEEIILELVRTRKVYTQQMKQLKEKK